MAAIIELFRGRAHFYEAVHKKDDDLYLKAIECWMGKYQPERVDTEKKVELMLQELIEIPTSILSIAQINDIGSALHTIASDRRKYREMITEKFKKSSDTVAREWYQKAYDACPKKW